MSKATVKTEVKSEGNKNVVKINIEDQVGAIIFFNHCHESSFL